MRHNWPADTEFTQKVLVTEDRACLVCGRHTHICDHRRRRIYTLDGPLELVCKLVHCPDLSCPAHAHTHSPPQELSISPPGWLIGWDVFCWIGHRRCSRHWSVPDLRNELTDSFQIRLSDDALSLYVDRYQTILAARQQDPLQLRDAYRDISELVLCIDGLQPEKGHETLYTVRELNAKRIWFAVPLLSSSEAEVRRVIAEARAWCESLNKPVRLCMSDKQDVFLKGIAAEFPGIPHGYCSNHFVRDLAEPVLDADSSAKVKMRKKVRGLRAIERQVLDDRRKAQAVEPKAVAAVEPTAGLDTTEQPSPTPVVEEVAISGSVAVAREAIGIGEPDQTQREQKGESKPDPDEAGEVVLAYCACVRGILNDDQGGPEHPTGLRMAEALQEVRQSLGRNLELEDKKGGGHIGNYSD
jgi:hypothetical protein